MKRLLKIFLILLATGICNSGSAQYCSVSYATGICNQPGLSNQNGNFINDFINDFNTCGAITDILNNNSGCNGLPGNLIYYAVTNSLIVSPGQFITCNVRSGNTFGQGFAIFIDWNQNNTFDLPAERITGTPGVPPAATWTQLNFTIPALQAPGVYRMRLRCSFATPGASIPPCGSQTFGETEDYNIVVTNNPGPGNGPLTATAISNSPLCFGQTLNLSVALSGTVVPPIKWSGPASFTSALQNPVLSNAVPAMSGVYGVTVGSGGCPVISTVAVVVAPNSDFTLSSPAPVICQGGTLNAQVSFSPGVNPAAFNYLWSPGLVGGGVFSPFSQFTFIQPPLQPPGVTLATLVYTVVVTPTVLNCPTVRTLTVTINNPLTPSLTMPPPVCNTFGAQQLTATPGGGTWTANAAVSGGGQLNPGLAAIGTNSVVYSVSVGTCVVSNSATFSVAQFNTPALTSSLTTKCVQDPAVNLMNIVQTTLTGMWTGPNVTGNQFFNPAGLPTGTYNLTYSTQSSPTTIAMGSVCPASTVLTVFVFSPVTPTIAPIAPVCNNASSVTLSASPPGGVWSTNSGVSSLGVQTPSLNNIGPNTVLYTAGLGTCVASTSANFHVSQFNTAALSASIANLCVSSNPVNLLGIVQNTSGVWSGINTGGGIFSPAGLQTNTYELVYVNLSSPNPVLCPDSRSITVHVLNPPYATITQVGPYCQKNGPVQLNVSPNIGSWTSSSYLSAGGIFTPSLAAIGANAVQYVIGTNTCNTQQTRTITVESFVPATIVNQVPDLCNTNAPFNLLPITQNNAGNWSGPGVLGSMYNPGVTGAGTFTLTYKTTSFPSGLCPDEGTVAVRVFSLATPIVTKLGPFCDNHAPVQLQVSPVGGIFGGGNTGAVTHGGIFNPALGIPGNNLVNYSISVGPCIAFAQATIAIEKFVAATFEKNAGPFCRNDQAIDLNSLVQNPGGFWSGPGVAGSIFDPSKGNLGNTNYIIYQTHSFPSALLCPDSDSLLIRVNPIPVVSAKSTSNKGCAPFEVLFNTPSTNSGSGKWIVGDGTEPLSGLTVNYVFKNPGIYNVVFNYADDIGCSARAVLDNPIVVHERPNAAFNFEPAEINISDPRVSLINESTVLGNNKYKWEIQGMSERTDVNPVVTFTDIGTYKVVLTATSLDGCVDEATRMLVVKNEFGVFIPNTFSPNYDGLNDLFLPVFTTYGIDARFFELEIFDRWGHSLYFTRDLTKGWDGTTQNKGDTPLKQDNYVYKMKFRDMEGRIYERTGSVTLMGN